MEPISPVLPHSETIELRVGEKQEEFKTLPSFRTEYTNITRWKLSVEERQHIASGGDLFLCQLNGKSRLQPIMPLAIAEDKVLETVLQKEKEVGL